MKLRRFDTIVNDRGSTVATFGGDAAGRKIVLFGGLGSNVESLRPFAHHLNEQSGRSVSVVDITRADSLADADRRSITAPFMQISRLALRLMATYPGMSDIASKQLDTLETFQPFSILHHADAAEEAIRKHVTEDDLETVEAVGHSWGTLLVEALMLHKDIVHDAALFNGIAGAALLPGETPSARIMALMADPDRSPERLVEIAGELYGGAFREHPELALEAHVARIVNQEAYSRQVRCLMSGVAIRSALPEITNRVLVVGSKKDDPITPWANSVKIHELIRNSILVEGPDGHMSIATDPARCAAIIDKFLKDFTSLEGAAQLFSYAH